MSCIIDAGRGWGRGEDGEAGEGGQGGEPGRGAKVGWLMLFNDTLSQ